MLTALMAAVADRLNEMPELAGASYPPLDHVPESPWAMVRQADEPTTYAKRRFGAQEATVYLDVILLVASSRETPRDQARLDGLPERVLDVFDASLTGGSAAELVPSLVPPPGADLHRLWNEAQVSRLTATWGTQFCYAAIVRLDVTYTRPPERAGV